MQVHVLKINAFQVTNRHDGCNVAFDIISNYTCTSGCSSIEHLAHCVNTCIQSFEASVGGEEISIEIDLKAIHDIEKSPNANFKLCSKLSEEEKEEFWKYFIRK